MVHEKSLRLLDEGTRKICSQEAPALCKGIYKLCSVKTVRAACQRLGIEQTVGHTF